MVSDSFTEERGELKRELKILDGLSRKNEQVLKGSIKYEQFTKIHNLSSKENQRSPVDGYSLMLESSHGVRLVESTADETINQEETDVSVEDIKEVDQVKFFVFDEYLILFGDNSKQRQAKKMLEELTGLSVEMVELDIDEIVAQFEDTASKSLSNVDEHTASATLVGDIDNMDLDPDTGEVTWAIGNYIFRNQALKVGVSAENNSIIVYNSPGQVIAAEAALEMAKVRN
ncbi:hypothetical protein [Halobaculum lipolyticum]|nr:hypothetical protein [Halobaculum sp. DT31]